MCLGRPLRAGGLFLGRWDHKANGSRPKQSMIDVTLAGPAAGDRSGWDEPLAMHPASLVLLAGSVERRDFKP